jgi:phosphoribosylaminoimidazolecarboxamide formyltransferase/IMP cyclohydrolase
MTDKLQVSNIFVAVFEKSVLDGLLDLVDKNSVKFWGTDGTIGYVKSKGLSGESVIRGFDFDGRVKSLDRANFARLLADKSKPEHMAELAKEKLEPIDLLIVDLYAPDESIFPESMDIGGQSLIRSAIKNYNSVALAFDGGSIADLVVELKENNGATTLRFRKAQAKKAAKFIAQRCAWEADRFDNML